MKTRMAEKATRMRQAGTSQGGLGKGPPSRRRTILDVARVLCADFFTGGTWGAWWTFLSAVFALPLSADDTAIYRACTGRQAPPTSPAREVWTVVGRRGGKSRMAALLAVYLACFRRYTLAPGERGIVMAIASDRLQARVVFRYITALINSTPMLAALVVRRTTETIDLSNGISIEIQTSSFRATRGYTIVCAILDEIAFWPTDDSANPDTEIVNALRPGMATTPGALLIAISSPYSRRGELFKAWKEHYGRDNDPILVWQAPTRMMNSTVPEAVIACAMLEDESAARAEWYAEFRTDLEAWIAREVVEAVVVPGRYELAPMAGTRYQAFVDPSGGSADSMTLAVAHLDPATKHGVTDAIREVVPPFSPESVVADFCALLQTYRVSRVTGDRYGGAWPRERFRVHGITYDLSERTKSDIYQAALPLLNSRRVELLDLPRLARQLQGLERRTARGGRDSIDHAPGQHDDIANATAGVLALVMQSAGQRMQFTDMLTGQQLPNPGEWTGCRGSLG